MNKLLLPLCILLACCAQKTTQQAPTPPSPPPVTQSKTESTASAPVQADQAQVQGKAGDNPFQPDGLSGRRVIQRPKILDASPKTGKVVVGICVDAAGDVVSVEYDKKNSTTDDSELVEKSIAWAKQFKFAPSDQEKQCGAMTFNFQLK